MFLTRRCFTIRTFCKTSNCSVFSFGISQIYHKFRAPSWVVQLIRGLPARFIAMHSPTIHHLLAPLIILAKDNYMAQRCTAEMNTNSYLTTWTTSLGGEGEASVQIWPQHHHWVHVHVCVCDCMLLRSCKSCIWVHIQARKPNIFFIAHTVLVNSIWTIREKTNKYKKEHFRCKYYVIFYCFML